jgi:fructokinase
MVLKSSMGDGEMTRDAEPLIAGVELGGTKCVCILGRGPDAVEAEVRLPTGRPDETLAAIEAVLDGWSGFVGIGIASFGPVSIDRDARDWGHVTVTTKPGWSGTDIAGRLARRYGKPVGFHTDVVGAALAEARWGAARGLSDIAYVTVGTGVGAGLIADGRPVDGLTHGEYGHLRPVRLAGDDWVGTCPFHGACIEGLAAGPAIAARAGRAGDEVARDDPLWEGVAHALAQLAHALVLTGVPRRIVWGGGVMGGGDLLPRMRALLRTSLGGYLPFPEIVDGDTFLVSAALGDRAGPLGAIVLGGQALAIRSRAAEPPIG